MKVTGSCEPSTTWAATSTARLRRARASSASGRSSAGSRPRAARALGGGMVGRIIETEADVAEGAAHLAAIEPRFGQALALTGPLPLRRRPDGFATLFGAIVSQQVSTAAAARDLGAARGDGRVRAGGAARGVSTRRCGRRGCRGRRSPTGGRSRRRTSTSWRCAGCRMPRSSRRSPRSRGSASGPRRSTRCSRSGGPMCSRRATWRCRRRRRGCSGWRRGRGKRELRAMAEAWSPWRAVAARLLLAYYRVGTGREGVR